MSANKGSEMFERLNPDFNLLVCKPRASETENSSVAKMSLIGVYSDRLLTDTADFSRVEFSVPRIASGAMVMLFGFEEMLKTYDGYDFAKYLADYLPVGDDGGGRVLTVCKDGVFSFDYGDLDPKERDFIADDLMTFLTKAQNLDVFLQDYL